jgi:hypothetical protein
MQIILDNCVVNLTKKVCVCPGGSLPVFINPVIFYENKGVFYYNNLELSGSLKDSNLCASGNINIFKHKNRE